MSVDSVRSGLGFIIMMSCTAALNKLHSLSMLERRGSSERRIGVLEQRAFERYAVATVNCSSNVIFGASNLLDSD